MRTWIVAAVTVTVVCWLAGPSLAGISGSAHDFGGSNWSDNQICLPCHTPHNAIIKDTNGDELPAPLWNHELSKATYTLYLDSSGNGVTGELDQYSKLCMSCHDGTVALDSFGGVSGNQYITRPQAILGTDLSNDHPIGEAAIWKGTYDPTAPKGSRWSGESTSRVSQNLRDTAGVMPVRPMADGQMAVACTSCHEPHNRKNQEHMLWVKNSGPATTVDGRAVSGSVLCLNCHMK